MIRLIAVISLIACTLGAAPTTRPIRGVTDFVTLERQAIALMQQEKLPEARQRLQAVYDATRPDARSRALVINHAVLDLNSRVFVMRGIKDLTLFLTAHPDEDELATNVLGSCLDIAAEKRELMEGRLWQAGLAEWEKRSAALETSRGKHRWGTRWISDEEFAQLQEQIKSSDEMIEGQKKRVEDAYWSLDAAVGREKGIGAPKLLPLTVIIPGQPKLIYHSTYVHKGWETHTESGQVGNVHWRLSSWGGPGGVSTSSVWVKRDRYAYIPVRSPDETNELERIVSQREYELAVERKRLYDLTSKRPYPAWPRLYPPVSPVPATSQPKTLAPLPTPAPVKP
jgi:hypothetical protein